MEATGVSIEWFPRGKGLGVAAVIPSSLGEWRLVVSPYSGAWKARVSFAEGGYREVQMYADYRDTEDAAKNLALEKFKALTSKE